MSTRKEHLLRQLEEAKTRSVYSFVELLCSYAEEEDHLISAGERASALEIYGVIAEQDVDGAEDELVDLARRVLEREGIATHPSYQSEYERFLQKMSEFDRHIFLARRNLLSNPRDAIAHLAAAAKIRPLGMKDARVYAGLVSRYGELT